MQVKAVGKSKKNKSKPHVEIVRLGDGRIRYFGLRDAARYLGVAESSLRRIVLNPDGNGHSDELNKRARKLFPALFPKQEEVTP